MATISEDPSISIGDSLAHTESGGNYNADNGLGYTGKYQFGEARLKDLGLGQLFTMEQYREDPEVQEWVFNQHIRDIDRYIDKNGLDQYIGKEVNGVVMDRSALQAVAHLGGNGGMAKFLRSGGKYNPSDAFGTSLLDYASTHGGVTGPRMDGTVPLAGSAREDTKPFMGMSDLPKSMRSTVLSDFAARMADGSEEIGAGLSSLNDDSLDTFNLMAQQATQPPTTKLSFGEDVPQVGNPMLPGAVMPGTDTPNATISTRNSPVSPLAAPTAPSQEPTEGPAASRFGDGVLEKMFGHIEDPSDRRVAGSDMLAALSTGLGQMSHGAPVDMSNVFQRMQQRQTSAAQSAQDEVRQRIDMQRLSNEMRRLDLDEAEHSYTLAKSNLSRQPGGGIFSDEVLAQYAADPVTRPFVDMIGSTNEDARIEGVKGLRQVAQDRASATLEGTEGNKDLGPLFEAVSSNAAPEQIAQVLSDGGYSPEALNAVYRATGKSPDSMIKQAQMYDWAVKNDPDLARSMEQVMQRTAGNDETSRERFARENYYKTQDRLDEQVASGAGLYAELEQMEYVTKQMIANGEEAGKLNPVITGIGNTMRQVLGDNVFSTVGSVVGIDAGTVNRLDALQGSEATLALMIAGPLMEGGGAISDGERALMLKTVARGDMSHGARLQMIKRLKQLHIMDKVVADKLAAGVEEEGFAAHRRLSRNLTANANAIIPQLRRAAQEAVAFEQSGNLAEFAAHKDIKGMARVERISPVMTQEQYDMFKDVVVTYPTGVQPWARRNEDGTITYMNGSKPIPRSK